MQGFFPDSGSWSACHRSGTPSRTQTDSSHLRSARTGPFRCGWLIHAVTATWMRHPRLIDGARPGPAGAGGSGTGGRLEEAEGGQSPEGGGRGARGSKGRKGRKGRKDRKGRKGPEGGPPSRLPRRAASRSAGPGRAGQGQAGQGQARQGGQGRQGKAGQGQARQGGAGQALAAPAEVSSSRLMPQLSRLLVGDHG
jgi:hypothetical protein